ncbi:MAG: hypothetical protein AAFP70_02215 [Calditrichota bacterium]
MMNGKHSGFLSKFTERLRQDLGYCLLIAYLLAFMQPTLVQSWHAVAHIYALAESEVAHAAADHVHAYNTHEHGDALETMLQMLMNGESAPLNEAKIVKTVSLQFHIPIQNDESKAFPLAFKYERPDSETALAEYKKRPFIPPPQLFDTQTG